MPRNAHPEEHGMKSKMIAQAQGQKTFLLVLDLGEEAFAAITEFAR